MMRTTAKAAIEAGAGAATIEAGADGVGAGAEAGAAKTALLVS